jgi:hypothetical protein
LGVDERAVKRKVKQEILREKYERIRRSPPQNPPTMQAESLRQVLERDSQLSDASLRSYGQRLEQLHRDGLLTKLDAPYEILGALARRYAEPTVRLAIVTIKKLLNSLKVCEIEALWGPGSGAAMKREYASILFRMNRESWRLQRRQCKSDRETRNWLTGEELRETGKDLKIRDDKQRALWLRLMLEVGTLRGDHRTLVVVKSGENAPEDAPNYVDMERRLLVISKYKHSKGEGGLAQPIPEDLWSDVEEIAREREEGKHLFLDNEGRPFTSSAFSKYIQEPFLEKYGKHVGSQMIRKIVRSEEQRDEPPLIEKQKRAANFLHSARMHELYRRL